MKRQTHQSYRRFTPLKGVCGLAGYLLALSLVLTPVPAWAEQDLEDTTLMADNIPTLQEQGMQPVNLTLKGRETVQVFHVTLPNLVKLVAEKNLDMAITGAQIDQAKGYMNQAISGLFPSIRAFSSVENVKGGDIFILSTPFPVDRRTYSPRISADYTVQLGGKVIYQINATKNQVRRIESMHDRVFQNALLEALTQYFVLSRDAANVAAAETSLQEADAQVTFNESRLKAGFGTKMDVTQSQVLQAERKNDLLKAENEREVSAITLASMLDMPLTVHLELASTKLVPYTFLDEKLKLTQLYDMALQARPDLRELDFQIKEAKARYGAARADLFPTLSLSAYRRGIGPSLDELQQTDQNNASISVDLLRNLGWGIMGEMQVQRARIKEAILNKEKQLNEIQKTLAQAYQDTLLYREQIGVTEQKVEAALATYKLAGARLRTGVGLNLELVQAQKELTASRLEHQTAIMNYNNAQLKLLYETGQLTPQTILFGLKALDAEPEKTAEAVPLPLPKLPKQAKR